MLRKLNLLSFVIMSFILMCRRPRLIRYLFYDGIKVPKRVIFNKGNEAM